MSIRNSVHQGVRRVVVDNLGDGSITVEPTPSQIVVECSIDAADEEFLEPVQVRQDSDTLRISFPHPLRPDRLRPTCASAYPTDLEYVIKAGSADISISARHRPVQDHQRLRRHQRRPGRRS